jgi:2,3-bisphosphoglycerate-independent phosphoglycerate mutase
MSNLKYQGPVVLVVMDGVGLAEDNPYNAVTRAHAETLHALMEKYPMAKLGAAGHYVGIPDGDMGNSEVGHNAMGAGEIVLQRSAAVEEAMNGGAYETQTWKDIVARLSGTDKTLHFMGIFSDGNVHSNISHLEKMMAQAQKDGIEHVRVHILLDGRDVPPTSEPKFIQRLENFVHELGDPDYRIASGGGRMVITADRYETDWSMVEAGWKVSVHGEGRQFANATEAVETYRKEQPGLQDQYMPAFVIAENGQPIGKIQDGDACIYIDFRADRALEMSMAFTYEDFPYFDRGVRPDVYFAGVAVYNEDLHVPEHVLVESPSFKNPLAFQLAKQGVRQYAISETAKFGHITYYFNGNSHQVPEGEVEEEVKSYTEPYNTRPWMRSAEITDKLVEAIESGKYDFLRVNYPGGDMVGHFGEVEPTITAMEAIDISIKRIIEAVNKLGGVTVITADHGNAEELMEDGKPKTSHTTNLVPCIIVDDTENAQKYQLAQGDFGLANISSTIAMLLNKEPDAEWLPAIIEEK